MRNLKKFLALVMAMVMAFSLMLTVNAKDAVKDWDDKDQVTEVFTEAVDVLSGMGVFQGDEEANTFRPASNITRGEMAAIIYRLATGDVDTDKKDLYTTVTPFTDVNEGDWFAPYVGYCWNAEIIKGTTPTTFNPYDNVTGYEVLAMVLRAMGYDANDEFTGGNWTIQVSAISTQRNLLKDVKTTHYNTTLHLASRRDVVASILFQAAQAERVKYTPAFGYQTGDHTVIGSDDYNVYTPLGELNFGLTPLKHAVVVGNQDTGEKVTRVSVPVNYAATGLVYAYGPVSISGTGAFEEVTATAPKTAVNYNMTFKNNKVLDKEIPTGTTGLEQFAHEVKVWYNKDDKTPDKTAYAILDKATKTAVVKASVASNAAGDLTNKGTDNSVAKAADKKGFKVGDNVAVNNAFDRFIAAPADKFTADSPVDLYALISNSDDNSLDVAISLNILTSQITAVDNVSAVKTVTVVTPTAALTPKFNDDEATGAATIQQGALLSGSANTLKDYEMGIHVTGTNGKWVNAAAADLAKQDDWDLNTKMAAASQGAADQTLTAYSPSAVTADTDLNRAFFKLQPIADPITVTITAYNASNGKLTLSDGSTLDRSVFYDTVVGGNSTDPNMAGTATLPQADLATATAWQYGTYKVWLDYEGKYLGAKLTYDNSFVYGTYMDYTQETSSGAFNYFLTGVTLEGEKTTVPVATKTWFNIGAGQVATNDIGATDGLDVPYRTGNAINNGIGEGIYKGWVVTDKNASDQNYNTVGVTRGTAADFGVAANPVIGKTEVALGAVQVDDGTPANGLYWTNDTKIILVSGYGTSDLKVTTYEGIDELTAGCRSVEIRFNAEANDLELSHIKGDTPTYNMTYYTRSPFVYAQTGDTGYKMDTVILPEAAVVRYGANNLYYVGDPTPTLVNTTGEGATQFTMYQDGVKKNVWVEGIVKDFGKTTGTLSAVKILDDYANRPGGTGFATSGKVFCDQFYYLSETGKTANDGSPIFRIDASVPNNDPIKGDATSTEDVITLSHYTATTYSSQAGNFDQKVVATNAWATAALTQSTLNVANAKIVNVNLEEKGADDSDWPGINNLGTLNEAGSLNVYGGGAPLYVTAIMNADNPLVVDYIYVCYNQDPPTT